MPAGRPSKYNEQMLVLANAYIEQFIENGDVVPTVAGMAKALEVTEKTLYNWAENENNVKFLQTFENLQSEQKRILVNKGLTGDFNSTIAKLMLHNHGYSDKADITEKSEVSIIEVQKDFD